MTKPSFSQRSLDLAIAIPLAIASLPFCLIALLAVRLETAGAPLLAQVRVGRNRQPFRMYKIRTMYQGTPTVASHEAGAVRITPLGAVLRKLKIDELPQLLNVIQGTMTLVGPRPCLPSQLELIEERERLGVLALSPGITGPGQLLGVDMSTPRRLAQIEADYFSAATPKTDIALIARTFLGRGRGDAARNPQRGA